MLELPPDITYYLQIVAFVAFALILRELIFKPTQALLDRRAERTTGTEREAEQLRQQAAAMQTELTSALQQARQTGSASADRKRREADAAELEVLDKAKADAAAIVAAMQSRLRVEVETARTQLRADAEAIAKVAAEKILGGAVSS